MYTAWELIYPSSGAHFGPVADWLLPLPLAAGGGHGLHLQLGPGSGRVGPTTCWSFVLFAVDGHGLHRQLGPSSGRVGPNTCWHLRLVAVDGHGLRPQLAPSNGQVGADISRLSASVAHFVTTSAGLSAASAGSLLGFGVRLVLPRLRRLFGGWYEEFTGTAGPRSSLGA